MHSPLEVKRIRAALSDAETILEESDNSQALSDYENELMPALDDIADKERVLYIVVDT